MSKEIRDQIESILAENNITYTVHYMGTKAAFDDDFLMDWWNVSFSTEGGKLEAFDYFTGPGHRIWDRPSSQRKSLPHGTKPHHYTRYELGTANTIHRVQMEKAHLKPCEPHAADVLYSLVNDSGAIEESFEDWCDNLGYDKDSRKALDTYLQCQKLGKQLQKIFSHDALAQMQTILQDY